MSHDRLVSCPGVLALELAPGSAPARVALERDEAEQLAAFMADDLGALLPAAKQAQLAIVGAHFDSAELLRPGYPVLTALEDLARRVDAGIVAFGSRDGHMPVADLVPETGMGGGALRVLPWTLLANTDAADAIAMEMERELVGRGEAGERTADYLMRTLDFRLEHMRYFSLHDLLALVCVHYENANLAALWELVEAALISPERAMHTFTAHGTSWRQAGGKAFARTPGTWLTTTTSDRDSRAHDLAGIVFELRQYMALLGAHHIPAGFDDGHHDTDGHFVVDTLAATDAALPAPQLFAHQAPGLGVIALSAAQLAGNHARVLANAWPLAGDIRPACRYLAATFGCSAEPERLGEIVLDANGHLTAPAASVHRRDV